MGRYSDSWNKEFSQSDNRKRQRAPRGRRTERRSKIELLESRIVLTGDINSALSSIAIPLIDNSILHPHAVYDTIQISPSENVAAIAITNANTNAPSNVIDGDFNRDGLVDIADYVTWRRTAPPASQPDQADFQAFRQNFGQMGLSYFGMQPALGSTNVLSPQPANSNAPTTVNSYTTNNQYSPAAASLIGGKSIVVWTGDGSTTESVGVWARLLDSNGNTIAGNNVFRVDGSATAGYSPVVASNGDNSFVIVWHDVNTNGEAKIYARRFAYSDVNGIQPAGGATPIWINNGINSDVNTFFDHSGYDFYPSVSMSANGSYVVTWRGYNGVTPNNNYDVYGRRYDAPSNHLYDPFIVATAGTAAIEYSDRHSVVADDSGFWVIWRSTSFGSNPTSYLFAKRANYSGTNNSVMSWNATTHQVASGTFDIYDASIGRDSQGNLLAVWSQSIYNTANTTVRASRYNGSTWETAFDVVDSSPLGVLSNVKGDSHGRFEIGLYQIKRPGVGSTTAPVGVFLTLYDPAQPTNQRLATLMPVSATNNVSLNFISAPGLTIGPNDEVLVIWAGYNGAAPDIYAKKFIPPVDGLIVSTTTDELDSTDFSYGDFSLREALYWAQQLPGPNIIRFGPLFNAPQIITLAYDDPAESGPYPDPLLLNSDVTIVGSGADRLTIKGVSDRVFLSYVAANRTIEGLTIQDGNAGLAGGGGILVLGGSLTLRSSRVTGNTAMRGAGIYSNGAVLTIMDSEISNNIATIGDGAGIWHHQTAPNFGFDIRNTTISGNRALGANSHGGGIFTSNFSATAVANGESKLVSSTVSDNSAASGGGIFSQDYSTTVGKIIKADNTIIAGNFNLARNAANDIAGNANLRNTSSNNLIGSGGNGGLASTNGNILLGVNDPIGLAPLAFNGGRTKTHALLPDSPAIDAGDPAFVPGIFTPPLIYDQRGAPFDRVVAARLDVGATEAHVILRQDGTLEVYGTSLNDHISVSTSGVTIDRIGTQAVNMGSVSSIHVLALGGDDQIDIASDVYLPAWVQAGDGNDTIHGGSGDDTFEGGSGTDTIYGGAGNDIIHGGLDNDSLYGDAGNDRIYGDEGNDSSNGGAGDDEYVYTTADAGAYRDTITDSSGFDTLDFSEFPYTVAVNLGLTSQQIISQSLDLRLTLSPAHTVENIVGDLKNPVIRIGEDSSDVSTDLPLYFRHGPLGTQQGLTFQVISNSNPTVVDAASINGDLLVLSVAANQSGASEVVVRATGAGGATDNITFQVVVSPVNDPPVASAIPDQQISTAHPDTSIDLQIAPYFSDSDTPFGDVLTYQVVFNNRPDLISTTFPSPSSNPGLMRFTTVRHEEGQAQIVVRATDSTGSSVDATINVSTVVTANTSPTAIPFSPLVLNGQSGLQVIDLYTAFTDLESPPNQLTYSISAPDNALLFKTLEIDSTGRYLRLEVNPDKTNLKVAPNVDVNGNVIPYEATVVVLAVDPMGLSATNNLGVSVLPTDSPASIVSVRLKNDTGVDPLDRLTGDPTLLVDIANDDDVEGVTIQIAQTSTSNVIFQGTTDFFGHLQFLPQPGLGAGVKQFYVRTKEHDDILGGDITSDWSPITINLQPGINAPPGVSLELFNDTDIVGDDITSDPTVRGQITNDGQVAGTTVEIDLDNNFNTVEATVVADSNGRFFYTPSGVIGLSGNVPVTVRARVQDFDYFANSIFTGPSPPAQVSFTYNASAANLPPNITSFGWDTTTPLNPRIHGSISNDGTLDELGIELHVTWNDGSDDIDNVIFLETDADGNFSYVPFSLPFDTSIGATITVTEPTTDSTNTSTTSDYAYIASPNLISDFHLANDTGFDGDGQTYDPTIAADLSSYPNTHIDLDFNDDQFADATVVTDENGHFEFTPFGLDEGDVYVKARVSNVGTAMAAPASWSTSSFHFVYQSWGGPAVTLQAPDDDADSGNGFASVNPAITGTVTGDFSTAFASIEFDSNHDDVADNFVEADENGQFTFVLNTEPGTYMVRARATSMNELTREFTTGEWSDELTYTVLLGGPTITALNLVHETNGPGQTTDPTLEGQVGSSGAYPYALVDLDYDGDHVADDFTSTDAYGHFEITPVGLQPGHYVVSARASVFDSQLQKLVTGQWSESPYVAEFDLLPVVGGNTPGTPEADGATDDASGLLSGAGDGFHSVVDTVVNAFNADYANAGLTLGSTDGALSLLFIDYKPLFNSHSGTVAGVGDDGAESGALPDGDIASPIDVHTLSSAPPIGTKTIHHTVSLSGSYLVAGSLAIDFSLNVLANNTFTLSLVLTVDNFHYNVSATPSASLSAPGLHIYEDTASPGFFFSITASGSFSQNNGVYSATGTINSISESALFRVAQNQSAPFSSNENGKSYNGTLQSRIVPGAAGAAQTYHYQTDYSNGSFSVSQTSRTIDLDYTTGENASFRVDRLNTGAATASDVGLSGVTYSRSGALIHTMALGASGHINNTDGDCEVDAGAFLLTFNESYSYSNHEGGAFNYGDAAFSDSGVYVNDEFGFVNASIAEAGSYIAGDGVANLHVTSTFLHEVLGVSVSSSVSGNYTETGGMDSSNGSYQSRVTRRGDWDYTELGGYGRTNGVKVMTADYALLQSATVSHSFSADGSFETPNLGQPGNGDFTNIQQRWGSHSAFDAGHATVSQGVTTLVGGATLTNLGTAQFNYAEDATFMEPSGATGDTKQTRTASGSASYAETNNYSIGPLSADITGHYDVKSNDSFSFSGSAHLTKAIGGEEDTHTLVAKNDFNSTYTDTGDFSIAGAIGALQGSKVGFYDKESTEHATAEYTVTGTISQAHEESTFHNEAVTEKSSTITDQADYFIDQAGTSRHGRLDDDIQTRIKQQRSVSILFFYDQREGTARVSESNTIHQSFSDSGGYFDENGDRTFTGWYQLENTTSGTQKADEIGDFGLQGHEGGFSYSLDTEHTLTYAEKNGQFSITPDRESSSGNLLREEYNLEKKFGTTSQTYVEGGFPFTSITESFSVSAVNSITAHDSGVFIDDTDLDYNITVGNYWNDQHGDVINNRSVREEYESLRFNGAEVRTTGGHDLLNYHESGTFNSTTRRINKGTFTRNDFGSHTASLSDAGVHTEGGSTSNYTETVSISRTYGDQVNGWLDDTQFEDGGKVVNHTTTTETTKFDKSGKFADANRKGDASVSRSSNRLTTVDNDGWYYRDVTKKVDRGGQLKKTEDVLGMNGYSLSGSYTTISGTFEANQSGTKYSHRKEDSQYLDQPRTTSWAVGNFDFLSTESATYFSKEHASQDVSKSHTDEIRIENWNRSYSYSESGPFFDTTALPRRSFSATFKRNETFERNTSIKGSTTVTPTTGSYSAGLTSSTTVSSGDSTQTQSIVNKNTYTENGSRIDNAINQPYRQASYTTHTSDLTRFNQVDHASSQVSYGKTDPAYNLTSSSLYSASHQEEVTHFELASYSATGSYSDVGDDGTVEQRRQVFHRENTSTHTFSSSDAISTWDSFGAHWFDGESRSNSGSNVTQIQQALSNSEGSVTIADGTYTYTVADGYHDETASYTTNRSQTYSSSHWDLNVYSRNSFSSQTATVTQIRVENLDGTYHESGDYDKAGYQWGGDYTLWHDGYTSHAHDSASLSRYGVDNTSLTNRYSDIATADHTYDLHGTYSKGFADVSTSWHWELNEDSLNSNSLYKTHEPHYPPPTAEGWFTATGYDYISIALTEDSVNGESLTGYEHVRGSFTGAETIHFEDGHTEVTTFNSFSEHVYQIPVDHTPPDAGTLPGRGDSGADSGWFAQSIKGIHQVLGLAGFIPGPAGQLASIINGSIYIAQGEYVNAGFEFASAATAGAVKWGRAGMVAVSEGKLAMKALLKEELEHEAARLAGKSTWLAKAAEEARNPDLVESLAEQPWIFMLYIGEKAYDQDKEQREAKAKIEAATKKLGVCFVAGTQVLVVDAPHSKRRASAVAMMPPAIESTNRWAATAALAIAVGGWAAVTPSRTKSKKRPQYKRPAKRRRARLNDIRSDALTEWTNDSNPAFELNEEAMLSGIQHAQDTCATDEAFAALRVLGERSKIPAPGSQVDPFVASAQNRAELAAGQIAANSPRINSRSGAKARPDTPCWELKGERAEQELSPDPLKQFSPQSDDLVTLRDTKMANNERLITHRSYLGHRLRVWTGRILLFAGIVTASILALRKSAEFTAEPRPQPDVQLTTSSLASRADRTSDSRSTKSIEQVDVGDIVLTRDGQSSTLTPRKVVRTFQRKSDHLRILRIRNSDRTTQEVRTTNEHPFWAADTGWVTAGKLRLNDRLVEPDGGIATVVDTKYEAHPEGIVVYNFEVEGAHTYFVAGDKSAASQLLVHNDCTPKFGVRAGIANGENIALAGDSSIPSRLGNPVLFTTVEPPHASPITTKPLLPVGPVQIPEGVARDFASLPIDGEALLSVAGVDQILAHARFLATTLVNKEMPSIPIPEPLPTNGAGKFKMVNSQ